jgi:hypothetical protein
MFSLRFHFEFIQLMMVVVVVMVMITDFRLWNCSWCTVPAVLQSKVTPLQARF